MKLPFTLAQHASLVALWSVSHKEADAGKN